MSPERNDPCPCGSGKKYKKCCGAQVDRGQNKPDPLHVNRFVAYKGAIGKRREAFCRKYIAFKQDAITDVIQELKQEVASIGQTISCHRGCNECCSCFVIGTVQECEAIVYYLYQHEEILQHFLRSYKTWGARIDAIRPIFNRAGKLQEKVMSGTAGDDERAALYDALEIYMRQKIACPFLLDGACSIYEVRPFVCAGVVATSPPEWCEPLHPCHGQVMLAKAEVFVDNDMPYFLKLQKIVYSCMPVLVNAILHQGYTTLASMPGLEQITHEVVSDPEVQAALREIGVT